ncbi:MepB family protein [Chitinophaga nivalis]|uniref:MepB family protein n=1 Tax=Chitinophaga nivalis TaxID=2991709 RepID=A0ABT3IMS7_9BACT|nr:MepB family protein [Chitinophaga nivalis]MCW3465043.1 MepB family protein [Chitinophaga nivalis]MCW3485265.1 MepB family protein [Chitinophaga nivalis]
MQAAAVKNIHPDFYLLKTAVFDKGDFVVTGLHPAAESQEYGACSFQLNGKTVQFRVSKITPTKTGQFVTIWQRNPQGITQPFTAADHLDFIVISARQEEKGGVFIFPKTILIAHGIITSEKKAGKRGIRVYPPWDQTTNQQALKTQSRQTPYFLPVPLHAPADLTLAQQLFTATAGI